MNGYVLVGFVLWLVLIVLACACLLALFMGGRPRPDTERMFGEIVPAGRPRNVYPPRLPR